VITHSPEQVSLAPSREVRRPVMTQGWHNLTYVHWRYPPNTVQSLLPSGFRVDTFDGSAWVGLIPFEMRNIAFPLTSRFQVGTGRFGCFPETNVRTYIVDPKGRRGVWFFSLDINRVAPTLIARVGYGLPYCFSEMTIETTSLGDSSRVRYVSDRRWPIGKSAARSRGIAKSDLSITIGQRIDVTADSLDAFTSARWALGSRFLGRNLWAEVDHPTWDLHEATLTEYDESLFAAALLSAPAGEPVVRWSPGVQVKVARPQILRRSPD
jgi:uncharacterized protein